MNLIGMVSLIEFGCLVNYLFCTFITPFHRQWSECGKTSAAGEVQEGAQETHIPSDGRLQGTHKMNGLSGNVIYGNKARCKGTADSTSGKSTFHKGNW